MNKVILISGGTSGFGKAAVREFLSRGWRVATFSTNANKVRSLRRELVATYPAKHFLVGTADVRDESSLKRFVNSVRQQFKKIDVLVNNAGYGYFVAADQVDLARYKDMLEVNVWGLAALTKLVLPEMKRRKRGRIINTASITGRPPVLAWSEFYGATKFAVMGWSEGLRNELRPFGIGVTTICPGVADTAFFTPQELERRKKLGILPHFLQAKDVAAAMVFAAEQPVGVAIEDITIRAI